MDISILLPIGLLVMLITVHIFLMIEYKNTINIYIEFRLIANAFFVVFADVT